MYETATARGGTIMGTSASTIAPPKQSAMAEHAQKLNGQASGLAGLNGRLAAVLERMHGPQPEPVGNTEDKEATPSGVLYVAQFGAEKISIEMDRMAGLISRLEQVA